MKKSYRGWGFYISLIVVVVLVWFLLDGQHLNQDDYNYAQFKQELADDEIKSCLLYTSKPVMPDVSP